MPSRLPIFPLSVVLFPGTLLPLHIFEPRYRRLLADCLVADRRFGITLPGAGGELPDPGAVGCVAEIRVNQELPDGCSNILVVGEARFVLTSIVNDVAPYHVALVQTFEDDPASSPPPARIERLREEFLRYAELLRQLNEGHDVGAELESGPVLLSFQVAAALDCDPLVKQRLLAERSTAGRVEALLLLLPLLTSATETALQTHHRARTNGRGSAHPELWTSG